MTAGSLVVRSTRIDTDQATSSRLTQANTRGARSRGARDSTVSPSHVARIAARDCDAISNGSGTKIEGAPGMPLWQRASPYSRAAPLINTLRVPPIVLRVAHCRAAPNSCWSLSTFAHALRKMSALRAAGARGGADPSHATSQQSGAGARRLRLPGNAEFDRGVTDLTPLR